LNAGKRSHRVGTVTIRASSARQSQRERELLIRHRQRTFGDHRLAQMLVADERPGMKVRGRSRATRSLARSSASARRSQVTAREEGVIVGGVEGRECGWGRTGAGGGGSRHGRLEGKGGSRLGVSFEGRTKLALERRMSGPTTTLGSDSTSCEEVKKGNECKRERERELPLR
jgi:hypothetical protein